MVMVTKVLVFSDLVSQGRWKVEFFLSSGGPKSAAYPLVCLRDVLSERREALDPQLHPSHVFIYLGLEHVQRMTGDLTDGYQPREGRAVLSRSKVFRRGDLLYGRLRPSLNKVFVADQWAPEGICSGEFYVLFPDTKRILPHFARALLASRYVQDFVKGMTTGSALPRLQLDDLLDIEVPLPPLEVQIDYESKLMALKEKRRQLTTALFNGPAAELDAVVNALERGTVPVFSTPAEPLRLDLRAIKLPSETGAAARGRGSRRGKT
jgi:hypothetical protein